MPHRWIVSLARGLTSTSGTSSVMKQLDGRLVTSSRNYAVGGWGQIFIQRADLGTCGARAVPDHSARGHPDSHKEAPSTEHRGGCGLRRTLAKETGQTRNGVRRKILDVQWDKSEGGYIGAVNWEKKWIRPLCIAPLALVKQDLKAQTYSLSQPIGFRDPGRDFPGLRDKSWVLLFLEPGCVEGNEPRLAARRWTSNS